MSPEPLKLIAVTVNNSNTTESPNELKMALDRERNLRLLLEDQVRQLEQQLFQQQQQQVSLTNALKNNKKVNAWRMHFIGLLYFNVIIIYSLTFLSRLSNRPKSSLSLKNPRKSVVSSW